MSDIWNKSAVCASNYTSCTYVSSPGQWAARSRRWCTVPALWRRRWFQAAGWSECKSSRLQRRSRWAGSCLETQSGEWEVSEKLKRSKNQVTAFRNQDIIHNVCAEKHVWLTAMVLLRLTCRGVDQPVSLDGCSHRVPGHPEARVPLVRDPKVSGTQHADFDTEEASNFRHGKHQHAGLKHDANVQVPKNCSSSIGHLDWLQKWLSQLKLSNFPDEPWIASFKSYLIKLKANLVNYGPIKSERRFIVWVERGEQQENFWLFKLNPLQLHVQQNRNRSTSELVICSLHLNDTELYFGCFSFL